MNPYEEVCREYLDGNVSEEMFMEHLKDVHDDYYQCSIGHPLYWQSKDDALLIAKKVSLTSFVETLATVLEETREVSGGRAYELMAMVTHLLTCRIICETNMVMGEVHHYREKGTL